MPKTMASASTIEGAVEELGFAPERLERARELCRAATESGGVPAFALAVARHGRLALSEAWGTVMPLAAFALDPRETSSEPRAVAATPETVWLIASVTKPVVCAGVCLLLERGQLALDDPVSRFLPEFRGEDRAGVRIRHLLTHSSGLPDMLPENTKLRRNHAPVEEFIRRACG